MMTRSAAEASSHGVCRRPRAGRRSAALVALLLGVGGATLGFGGIAGCGGSGAASAQPGGGDPLLVAKSDDATTGQRVRAVEQIWESVETGRLERRPGRESLKTFVWSPHPTAVRTRAIEMLLQDETEEGIADTRNMLALRLPTETDWGVIRLIGDEAAKRGWTDLTAPLVRSYARPVVDPEDADRPERGALERLHPGVPVVETVYHVFATRPPSGASGPAAERAERARRDAWELLGRLDATGAARKDLLTSGGDEPAGDPLVDTLRLAARELRAVPITGSELEWVLALRSDDAAARAWWQAATAALATLSEEQVVGLAVRHAEPARWAARHRPEWLRAGRGELLAELRGRLTSRKTYEREAEAGSAFGERRERLVDNEAKLAWGDVLAILVIDESLADPATVAALFEQVTIDRRDTSTEHGGVIEAVEGSDGRAGGGGGVGAGFRALHYPPRPAQRRDDSTFIAPEELFQQTPRALAHYHFHVQRARNAEYAGPGPGDTEYAQKHGRSCLVFTSLDERTLNVDYYHRGGAVVDLGEVRSVR